MILDVFSRYVVGWTVQYRENAQLAKALIEQAAEQQQITPKILTLHAARARVLEAAHARNPERFVSKPPVPPELPTAAWINKPKEVAAQ